MWTAKNGLSSSPKLCSLRSKLSISVSMKFLFPVMQPFLLLISKQLADYVAMVALAIDGYFFQSWYNVTSSRSDWVGARVLYFVGVWVRSELGMLCMKLVVFFFKPLTDLSQPWTIFLWVGASGDKNCNSRKTGSCWCCQWSIDVGAGNLLGVRRIFCPDFPKFARKTFLYKLSFYKFSVAVGTLHFPQPCCHTYFTFQMAD